MLQYLETRREIAIAQQELERTIRREFPRVAVKDIGHPGGREARAKVATDGRYWFWSKSHNDTSVPLPRRLNWFGVLSESPGVSITVEVNTAYGSRNDQVAGFFARDLDTGMVYLLHSGRLGGGAKGVRKSTFLTWATKANQALVEVADSSGNIRDGLIVMPVRGMAAAQSARRYIDTVRGFKAAARSGKLVTKSFLHEQKKFKDYYAEGRGRRTGRRKSQIDYVSRHGDIVDALQAWRKSRPMPKNSRVVKDVFIDMGVTVQQKLAELFEVKPSADRSVIYSALGQLLVHGREDECRKTMVLPHNGMIANDLADALRRLRIDTLRFKIRGKTVTILEVDRGR